MGTAAPPPGTRHPTAEPGPDFNVCFHGVGTLHHEREPGESAYWITEGRLHEILDWVVGIPRVTLSFDDGNRSDLEAVLPALVERGLKATFFPVVGRLGDPWSLSGRGVEELLSSGMDVGTHGLNHVPWTGLRGSAAREEILRPRHVLEDLLGRGVDRTAAPLGRYDRRSLALLRADGCTEVNVSDQRPAGPGAWVQPRFSVRADDTVSSLRSRMLGSLAPARRARNCVVSAVKRWR